MLYSPMTVTAVGLERECAQCGLEPSFGLLKIQNRHFRLQGKALMGPTAP